MNALRYGFRAVQYNLRSLAVYAGLAVVLSAILVIVRRGAEDSALANPLDPTSLLITASVVFVGAVAQTTAFTWMGQRLGRPLWKFDLGEGFREFFGLWLFIQTLEAALWIASSAVHYTRGDDSLTLSVIFASIPIFVLTTPAGACVMYQGRLNAGAFKAAARVLVDCLPQALVLFLFSGAVFFFILTLHGGVVDWAAPLISIIGAYFDVVIFGAAWALAADHERTSDDHNDLDF